MFTLLYPLGYWLQVISSDCNLTLGFIGKEIKNNIHIYFLYNENYIPYTRIMKSFKELISTWGTANLAVDCGVSEEVVRKWKQADYIPAKSMGVCYWARILLNKRKRKVKITADDLVRLSDKGE